MPMTTEDLTHFRTVLEAREIELIELLRDRDVIAVNLSADMLDQIQLAQERDILRKATKFFASEMSW